MNIKAELIAVGIRVLTDRGVIRPADPFDNLFSVLFTGQTAEQRMATDLADASEKATTAIKRAATHRKLKKLAKDV